MMSGAVVPGRKIFKSISFFLLLLRTENL